VSHVGRQLANATQQGQRDAIHPFLLRVGSS
jgi:hypothetical protein